MLESNEPVLTVNIIGLVESKKKQTKHANVVQHLKGRDELVVLEQFVGHGSKGHVANAIH